MYNSRLARMRCINRYDLGCFEYEIRISFIGKEK